MQNDNVQLISTQKYPPKCQCHAVLFLGTYPHVVINNLHRLKLDANRDKPEATFGEETPELAWEEFHNYIDEVTIFP